MTDKEFCLGIAPLFTDEARLVARESEFEDEGWDVINENRDDEVYGQGPTEAAAWADCRSRYEDRRRHVVAQAEQLKAFGA